MSTALPSRAFTATDLAPGAPFAEGEPFQPAGQTDHPEPPPWDADRAEGGGIHAAAITPPAVDQRNKVMFLS